MKRKPTLSQVDAEIEALVRQAKNLEREVHRREREEAILFYKPHALQDKFHRSKSRIRVILGANRSGKSEASMCEAVAYSLGYRPWLKESDPDYKIEGWKPGVTLIVGESFGEQVRNVLVAKLLGGEDGKPGLIPQKELNAKQPSKKNPQGIVTQIFLANGHEIRLQSFDQPPELFEGTTYSSAFIDEPPPRKIWIAIQRGLVDSLGPTVVAMTPLKEPWIFDEIITREDVEVLYFDIQDNVGHGITQEAVDDFARNLTEDEKETRLHGKFFQLQGLVYKTYSNNLHIYRKPRFEIPKNFGWWMAIDPHPRVPHHALWVAVRPDGIMFVAGELVNADRGNGVAPFADAIWAYEKGFLGIDHKKQEVNRIIDPSSTSPNPMEGGTIWDTFADKGIICRKGSKNLQKGILTTQSALAYNDKEGVYPILFFFDDLETLHYEMTRYVWDEWLTKQGDSRTIKQTPRDKDDHMIENLHRILLDEPYAPHLLDEDEELELQARENSYSSGFSVGY